MCFRIFLKSHIYGLIRTLYNSYPALAVWRMETTKVKDVYKEGFEAIKETDTLSKAIEQFESRRVPALLVTDEKGIVTSVLSRRWLRRTTLDPSKTRVEKLARHAPVVQEHDRITETARLMVENQVMQLPVYAGKKLRGVITNEDIIQGAMDTALGSRSVREVMTADPIAVRPDDSIGSVVHLFRNQGFSHAPVVEKDRLEGIVSVQDIADIAFRHKDRQTRGERTGNKQSISSIPVKSIMSVPVFATRPDDSLQHAYSKMREKDVTSLVVVQDGRPVGIVTKADLLEPIAQRAVESRQVTLQFSVKPDVRISDAEREAMLRDFESLTKKYKKTMGLGSLFVYMKAHGAESKGDQLVHCRMHLRTSHSSYHSTAEAWSAQEAFSLGLERLERGLMHDKETELDPEFSWRRVREYFESEI
ncbi:CBS domain-containing protein [Candidatus Thorarchaeota archaeon]|nr:MAG: CBS domain-containing protein [Candidatus Thorarchaeota archaeon]